MKKLPASTHARVPAAHGLSRVVGGLRTLPGYLAQALMIAVLHVLGAGGQLSSQVPVDQCLADVAADAWVFEHEASVDPVGASRPSEGPDEEPEPGTDDSEESDAEAEDAPEGSLGLRTSPMRVPLLARAADADRRSASREVWSGRRSGKRHGARGPPAKS